MNLTPRRRWTLLPLSAALLLPSACQRTVVTDHLESHIAQRETGSDLDFWHSLPGRSAVTNSEGFHGVLLLSDGDDRTATWDERLALLKERGWVEPSFNEAGDVAMQRGTLAKAICHAIDIKGGVMMRLTNRSPRYAVRELAYLRVMAPTTENQIVKGLDYIGIMSRAQDHRNLREAKRAAKEAGSPPPETPETQDALETTGG